MTRTEEEMTAMTLSEGELATINERLVRDFHAQIPLTTVIAVLRGCALQSPGLSPELVEQAARIQLQIRRQGQI
jgi:hypothetical protein